MFSKFERFWNKPPKETRCDIIDLNKNSKDTINQCVMDWRRSAGTIFFVENGKEKSLQSIFEETGVNYAADGFDLTVEQLSQIWYEHILEKAFRDNQQQRQIMFVHFSELMHQGGYLNMLQASLCYIGINRFAIPSDSVDRKFVLDVVGNKIVMEESLGVKDILVLDTDEHISGDGKNPAMTATVKSVLHFDEDGVTPKLDLLPVSLEYNNKLALPLFDKQESQMDENTQRNLMN